MATEPSSLEFNPQKRQRRAKQDPQFLFERPTTSHLKKQNSTNALPADEENATSSDLYQPGDIVWSKLGNFPWWPALIHRCDAEGGIYTKTLNSHHKTKRQYFVYFYGKYLQYAWLSTRSLMTYAGLEQFIQHAESAVEQVSTKSEQIELANRYQLKVSTKKRPQWDESIELADRALKLTKDERINAFTDLLHSSTTKKKNTKKSAKSLPIEPVKKKAKISSDNEIEYEYVPLVHPSPQIDLPPLSNFELKQIVEGLINHNTEKTLSFNDAELFATSKAIEIVYENHNYRMTNIPLEWFYDAILLRNPSLVFKYRAWYDQIDPDQIPDGNDLIELKQWQIALMIEAQVKHEQLQNQ